jgi:hypothetical protein
MLKSRAMNVIVVSHFQVMKLASIGPRSNLKSPRQAKFNQNSEYSIGNKQHFTCVVQLLFKAVSWNQSGDIVKEAITEATETRHSLAIEGLVIEHEQTANLPVYSVVFDLRVLIRHLLSQGIQTYEYGWFNSDYLRQTNRIVAVVVGI